MSDLSLRTGDDISDSEDDIEEMLQKYAAMVYRLALTQTRRQMDAEDVFQEVFVRYVKHPKSFVNEEHRKAWLIRVTINCSRKLLRSPWFRRNVPLEDESLRSEWFDTVEKSDVYDAVMSLPRKYRTVIHLFYYEDLSIERISSMLSIKETTVKSQLHRARQKLKELLKGDFGHA